MGASPGHIAAVEPNATGMFVSEAMRAFYRQHRLGLPVSEPPSLTDASLQLDLADEADGLDAPVARGAAVPEKPEPVGLEEFVLQRHGTRPLRFKGRELLRSVISLGQCADGLEFAIYGDEQNVVIVSVSVFANAHLQNGSFPATPIFMASRIGSAREFEDLIQELKALIGVSAQVPNSNQIGEEAVAALKTALAAGYASPKQMEPDL